MFEVRKKIKWNSHAEKRGVGSSKGVYKVYLNLQNGIKLKTEKSKFWG